MTAPSVLHLVPSRGWGGAEQVADTLRSLAVEHGWLATLDLPRTRGARWSPDATTTDSWLDWAVRARAPTTVVHAHLPWPDRLGPVLLAARGRPLVVTFHLLTEPGPWPRDCLVPAPGGTVLRLAGRLRRRVRWVALSTDDGVRLGAILGTPVHKVRNAPPRPVQSTAGVTWPPGVVRLLSVGRLEWQKGYDRMLDALGHPTLRDRSWHWVLLGDGADRAALEVRANHLGLSHRVTFAGARPAADGWSHADLLLAPSRREGMPLVPLEAMEAGVPVVASGIAPHRELFARAPDGLLPDDPAHWPLALARWIGDPPGPSQPAEATMGEARTARDALALAQRAVLGNTPRAAFWVAYEALYLAAARE